MDTLDTDNTHQLLQSGQDSGAEQTSPALLPHTCGVLVFQSDREETQDPSCNSEGEIHGDIIQSGQRRYLLNQE